MDKVIKDQLIPQMEKELGLSLSPACFQDYFQWCVYAYLLLTLKEWLWKKLIRENPEKLGQKSRNIAANVNKPTNTYDSLSNMLSGTKHLLEKALEEAEK